MPNADVTSFEDMLIDEAYAETCGFDVRAAFEQFQHATMFATPRIHVDTDITIGTIDFAVNLSLNQRTYHLTSRNDGPGTAIGRVRIFDQNGRPLMMQHYRRPIPFARGDIFAFDFTPTPGFNT